MGFRDRPTAEPVDAPAETFDGVRGFKNLPPKDQILAASIYAGFRQALREERLEAERMASTQRQGAF